MYLAVGIVILAMISLGLIVFARRSGRILNEYDQIKASFYSFIEPGAPDPEGKDTASQAAQLVDLVATRFAARVQTSMQGSIMGQKSGEVRAEKAMSKDLVRSALGEENALLKLGFDKLPKGWQSMIIENPDYIAPALKIAKSMGIDFNSIMNGGGNGSGDPGKDYTALIKGSE